MKVWCWVLLLYFWLLATNAAFAKPNSEGSFTVSENDVRTVVKTNRFPLFKVKETKGASLVNKAVIGPKSGKLGGIGPGVPKNSSCLTGTGIHPKR